MPQIKSGLACPICDAGGVTSELLADSPGMRTVCPSGKADHVWFDRSELMALKPRLLAVVKKPDAIQANYVSLELKVPMSVKTQLEARYGDKLQTSLTSVLQACAEPTMMILNATDLQRIGERIGQVPKSSSELFGILFQAGEAVKEAKNENELLIRRMNIRKGDVMEGCVVDLGAYLPKAVAKAADVGVSLEELLGKYLRDSLENDWITS